MEKLKSLALIVITLIVFQIILVSAEEIPLITGEQEVSSLDVFLNNFKHNFGIDLFSIVGTSRGCGTIGGNANSGWYNIQSGQQISTVSTGTYNGFPIINANYNCVSGHKLYNIFTNGWTPYAEFRNGLDFICNSPPCNVEVYCCPSAECSPINVCPAGSGCVTKSSVGSVVKGTKTYYWFEGESQSTGIPYQDNHYSYCKEATSTTKKCWYIDGNQCSSYDYNSNLFPNICETYLYQGRPLYTEKSVCESNIIQSPTTPTTPTTPTQTTPGGTDLTEAETVNVEVKENERELLGKVQIYSISYGDAVSGDKIETFYPGQTIKVNFRVKADVPIFYDPYLVEVGIIPLSTAQKWEMDRPSGGYSIESFAIGESQGDACCLGQPNVADNNYEFKKYCE